MTQLTAYQDKFVDALRNLYTELGSMDYMSPYSYREVFKDKKIKEVFMAVTKKLSGIKETYCE